MKKELKLILHPFVFVLKEGKEIKQDYLDYSLMMLQVGRPEILKSPVHHPVIKAPKSRLGNK